MSRHPKFNPVTATAAELQQLLESRALTSVDIVETYLGQIERHNRCGLELRALISVAPRTSVLAIAASLDAERENGKVRGPLHGLPIIVKDAITTGPELGMGSTAGAYVFVGSKMKKNAAVIELLIAKGVIILGKANMTEFCGMRATEMPPGYSATGGQTRSAYWRPELADGDQPTPGGSSAGSGVGVSAGFAPLALGTDTVGSSVYPAGCAGLYGLNPSTGAVALDGVQSLSRAFDCIGTMAKTAADLTILVENVLTPAARSRLPKAGYGEVSVSDWQDVSIAFTETTWGCKFTGSRAQGSVVGEKWADPAIIAQWEDAVAQIRALGARAVYPANPPDSSTLAYKDGSSGIRVIAFHEFKSVIENFMTCFENPKVRSLAELVKWNEENAEKAMPEPFADQTDLISALNDPTSDEECEAAVRALKKLATDSINAFMTEHGVEIITAASDSTLVSYAAHAGCPIATIPLGNLESNGQPFGFFLLAKVGREDVLLRFMRLYDEAGISRCAGPSALV